jgi:murein DD-endopeptidase MepM/ murein hydrolase activator NlpD
MTVLGVALSFGASVPLLSVTDPVLAVEGLAESVTGVNPVVSSDDDSKTLIAYHTVESGDSLWQIADQHDADVQTLKVLNSISQDEVLRVGQVLRVPPADFSESGFVDAASTSALTGVGGEAVSLASVNSSLTLRSVEEFRDDWVSLEPAAVRISAETPQPQSEGSSEALSAEASLPEAETSVSATLHPTLAGTLVSFSPTGSLVPVSYPTEEIQKIERAPSSWVDASTPIPPVNQPGDGEVALSQPQVHNSANRQLTQLPSSHQAESVSLAFSNTSDAAREQRIRDSLARIRESNTITVDRDELNARLSRARQYLERSRAQLSEPSPVSSSQASTRRSPSLRVSLDSNVSSESSAGSAEWEVADVADTSVADTSDATTRLAKLPEPGAAADTLSSDNSSIAADTQRLLAAAPLNPDIYRPLPNTSTGETVVPGMPMLPGAGEFLPEAPASSNGYVWPTRGTFTSGYGWRWGRMHRGIDIAGPVGTPIVAAASGVVVRSGWNSGGYGNVVDIRHPDGSMTRYAHNSRLLVREGQQVRQGQSIAHMGSTGYSTGPHLHFEIHLPGSGTVNPIAYLPGR